MKMTPPPLRVRQTLQKHLWEVQQFRTRCETLEVALHRSEAQLDDAITDRDRIRLGEGIAAWRFPPEYEKVKEAREILALLDADVAAGTIAQMKLNYHKTPASRASSAGLLVQSLL